MQKSLVALLAAALLAGCGTHVSPVSAVRNAGQAPAVKNMTGAEIFKRLDTNQDGKLSLPEFQQLGIFGVNGRLWEPKPLPPLPEAQTATFKSFDKDHDDAVDAAEFENFGVALQFGNYRG